MQPNLHTTSQHQHNHPERWNKTSKANLIHTYNLAADTKTCNNNTPKKKKKKTSRTATPTAPTYDCVGSLGDIPRSNTPDSLPNRKGAKSKATEGSDTYNDKKACEGREAPEHAMSEGGNRKEANLRAENPP